MNRESKALIFIVVGFCIGFFTFPLIADWNMGLRIVCYLGIGGFLATMFHLSEKRRTKTEEELTT